MKRVHVIIYGEVQGVFFRAYVKKTADSIGIKGWVKNKINRSVEAIAEGSKEQLDEFLKKCSEGPQTAEVVEVRRSWEKSTGEFKSFEIRY
ncbi:acylphosphatase [Candidatus Woesearchaeota archaeon]|nr:acylphosphatase [Candidatus Woesearchaeota archaeon]